VRALASLFFFLFLPHSPIGSPLYYAHRYIRYRVVDEIHTHKLIHLNTHAYSHIIEPPLLPRCCCCAVIVATPTQRLKRRRRDYDDSACRGLADDNIRTVDAAAPLFRTRDRRYSRRRHFCYYFCRYTITNYNSTVVIITKRPVTAIIPYFYTVVGDK